MYKNLDLSKTYVLDKDDLMSIAVPIGASITTFKNNVTEEEVAEICSRFLGEAQNKCVKGYKDAVVDSKPRVSQI